MHSLHKKTNSSTILDAFCTGTSLHNFNFAVHFYLGIPLGQFGRAIGRFSGTAHQKMLRWSVTGHFNTSINSTTSSNLAAHADFFRYGDNTTPTPMNSFINITNSTESTNADLFVVSYFPQSH